MTEKKKRKRRQYGTGGLRQRKSDGRWYGTIEAGFNANGERRRITVSDKDEARAKAKLRDKLREIERDGLPTTSGRATVKAWADEWLDIQVTRKRPAAYTADRSAVRQWIVPTIGKKKLTDLTPADVRAVAKAQRAAGRSTGTALRTHTVLMKMLKDAIVDGHAVPPRVLLVERPSAGVNDREAMTVEEATKVLEAAMVLPHRSRWVAALLQGMRQAECLGLTWSAVDLDKGVIDVSWQLQALPYLDKHNRRAGFRVPDNYEAKHLEGAWHLVRPKTEKGYRMVPIVPWMAQALTGWRETAVRSPYGLVWPRATGGPCSAADDLDEWKGLQGAAGVGHPDGRFYVLHEARHTTATLLLEAGIDPEVIKAILGHSSIVTSRGYQHVSTRLAADALARVADRLALGG